MLRGEVSEPLFHDNSKTVLFTFLLTVGVGVSIKVNCWGDKARRGLSVAADGKTVVVYGKLGWDDRNGCHVIVAERVMVSDGRGG